VLMRYFTRRIQAGVNVPRRNMTRYTKDMIIVAITVIVFIPILIYTYKFFGIIGLFILLGINYIYTDWAIRKHRKDEDKR
jgi:uncharacterized membrane protein YqjE